MLSLKRHPELKDSIVGVILQFSRFNFLELFTKHLKNTIKDPKDFLYTIQLILVPLSESDISKDEVSFIYFY